VGERFGPFWGLTPMVCELAWEVPLTTAQTHQRERVDAQLTTWNFSLGCIPIITLFITNNINNVIVAVIKQKLSYLINIYKK
jgi:hypothetical protein